MKQFEYKTEKVLVNESIKDFDELKFLNIEGNLGWQLASIDWVNSETVSRECDFCYQYLFVREKINRPRIITLCGSTRFVNEFRKYNLEETLKGNIVLSIGCDIRTDQEVFGNLDEKQLGFIKEKLDELHKRKIDISDEILVLNVGGYIGDSTREEIEYAKALGKVIRYIEN